MAEDDKKANSESAQSKVPSEEELFAGEISKEVSLEEVFGKDAGVHAGQASSFDDAHRSDDDFGMGRKRFSLMQKILAAGIAVVGGLLIYGLVQSQMSGPASLEPLAEKASRQEDKPAVGIEEEKKIDDASKDRFTETTEMRQLPEKAEKVKTSQSRGSDRQQDGAKPTAGQAEKPASLLMADELYRQKKYASACQVYAALADKLPQDPQQDIVRDFLTVKMAYCRKNLGQVSETRQLWQDVLDSESVVVRVAANYQLAFMEKQNRNFFKARRLAYKAMCLVQATDMDKNRAQSLIRDCKFVLTECLSRAVLGLCDADKEIPGCLWMRAGQVAPLEQTDSENLREFLSYGKKHLARGVLTPKIEQIEQSDGSNRWQVICTNNSAEELLCRFAKNCGADILWASQQTPQASAAKRAVSVYFSAATEEELFDAAAGSAGLLACQSEQGNVRIYNPENYESLSDYISLMSSEAIGRWRSFLLTFHEDDRVANAHFIIGLLKAANGDVSDVLAEYKLVANRFPDTALAPYALFHSGLLKARIKDYKGGRDDLRKIVERYPDCEIADKSLYHLAEVTRKASLYAEAAIAYEKVYNSGFSDESKQNSAYGAGRSYYQLAEYAEAAKWLIRYTKSAKNTDTRQLYTAYFLLGESKAKLGELEQACRAFEYALNGKVSEEEYLRTAALLVDTRIEQGNFLEALDVPANLRQWQLSQKSSLEVSLLRARVLREMGLIDKSLTLLDRNIEYISDKNLRARMSFEQARCMIVKEQYESACDVLMRLLLYVEDVDVSQDATLKLVEVLLELRRNKEAVRFCRQLLESDPPEDIRKKTLILLGKAYKRQKDYESAALALTGKWKKIRDKSNETIVSGPLTDTKAFSFTQ